jgi:hypothetical protein
MVTEDEWEHWSGPFLRRDVAEACCLNLNIHSFARQWYLFEVFPDEEVEGKWVIKKVWKSLPSKRMEKEASND